MRNDLNQTRNENRNNMNLRNMRLEIKRNNSISSYTSMLFACFTGFLLLVGVLIHFNIFEPEPLKPRDRLMDVGIAQLSDASAIPVRIGFYIKNNYSVMPETKTFDSDGWIWLSWSQHAQDILTSRKITPEKWINFVNQVKDWDFKFNAVNPEPIRMKDGQYYQRFKYSGHFYINNLDFHKYPFHTLTLPIVLELVDFSSNTSDPVFSLIADEAKSGVGTYIDIMGYHTRNYRITTQTHEFGSNFGLNVLGDKPVQTRQIAMEVAYQQSANASILNYFLPLITVMALALFAPALSSSLLEVRLGIPPTALLTLIFLQQIYKDKLPNLPYLTFMDTVYNTCYLANVMLFALFLWGSNQLDHASEVERTRVIAKIDAINLRFQIGIVTIIFAIISVNWFLLCPSYI
ncbi:ligand-gated ion channel [Candidatus Methylospira mobilis]|nr:hypothetical protein [Candidatus Methylospira mobilis]